MAGRKKTGLALKSSMFVITDEQDQWLNSLVAEKSIQLERQTSRSEVLREIIKEYQNYNS